MIIFFRKLPLIIKLLLIGLTPILFLIYFSTIIYKEKSINVKLISDYIERIDQSANVGELINTLGKERRYSYFYLLKKDSLDKLQKQRLITDSLIKALGRSPDLSMTNFRRYTFLDSLSNIRSRIDSKTGYRVNDMVQYYTDAIFRLNTLNSYTAPSTVFLTSVYQDLTAQRILAEMLTLLGIIRTNIYNALYSKEYMVETLIGTNGAYKVYNSYELEFKLKASPASQKTYDSIKNSNEFKAMFSYIDRLFTKFKFDSTYDAEEWWTVSSQGLTALNKQQKELWTTVEKEMKDIYQIEKKSQKNTFVLIAVSLLFVIILILSVIRNITRILRELKLAARKISKGGTGVRLENMPRGVIGNLAKSILQIETNNLMLANAASEIGKGNFNVTVRPRSEEDLLGKSIKKMEQDLYKFNSQKDRIQRETLALVHQRDELFSMTSHELKTPLTSLKAYTQLLLMDVHTMDNDQRKILLDRMDKQISKLVGLINDLLDLSRLQYGQLNYNKKPVKLNHLIAEIISEIQLGSAEHKIIFQKNINVTVNADYDRIGQVVTNLLINAVKYSPGSREIIVRLDKTDKTVICSVKDFGHGIKKEEQTKIFERFYRVSGDNLNTYPGLGLGLYISKEIIEKHDGKLWIESEYGKGSIFYFELPLIES
ncbi:MAG TPA: ATP-binding protein [Hanamia sp.]|nr:ATP-binding protein [Hanamia sp.]